MDTNSLNQILGSTARASLVLVDADRLADALAQRLAGGPATHLADAWLDVEAAAQHLRCPTSRIYDLKAAGRLRFAKDGTRLLFRREWLDEALHIEHDPRS